MLFHSDCVICFSCAPSCDPAGHQTLCDLLSGQFTGADDLVTKSGKAEFKRAAILVQQYASNVKAALCLFLRQPFPGISRGAHMRRP